MKTFQTKLFPFILSILIAAQLLAVRAPTRLALAQEQPAEAHKPVSSVDGKSKLNPLAFRQANRKLWEDHVTWTRVFVIAALADLPEAEAAAGRLLQNQADIGDAIRPFYGDQAGDQLTALLREHILIAADLLAAAKAGDTAAFEQANAAWYENADQIAAFLHSANPENWPLEEMQAMMKDHLDLTLQEAVARLNQDWEGDVAVYDQIHLQILGMADMLAEGIIRQFPKQFKPQKASQQEVELALAMDKLWEDHITWTRMYMISATSNLPDAQAAAERLLQNQSDIGNAVKPFYGEQAGDQLTALLNDHILIAVDLLDAAIAGDSAGFDAANTQWYENADQIAAFLHNANPKGWPLAEMQVMMQSHLDLTLEEAVARLNADWAGDVAAYDKVHEEILEMAAMLTRGLVEQFPQDFK